MIVQVWKWQIYNSSGVYMWDNKQIQVLNWQKIKFRCESDKFVIIQVSKWIVIVQMLKWQTCDSSDVYMWGNKQVQILNW